MLPQKQIVAAEVIKIFSVLLIINFLKKNSARPFSYLPFFPFGFHHESFIRTKVSLIFFFLLNHSLYSTSNNFGH